MSMRPTPTTPTTPTTAIPVRRGHFDPGTLRALGVALLLTLGSLPAARATPLEVRVVDASGAPLEDAVVTLMPLDGQSLARADGEAGDANAVLAQRNHRFVPFVLPIRRGTRVEFPNYDDTRHHVYSFSPIRPFEIQLYKGDPETTIDFPEVGVAAIGCNIHDYMQAFVFVTDAPRFALTGGDGRAVFAALPEGRVEVAVWHPWQQQQGDPLRVDGRAADGPLSFTIDPAPPPPRRPAENALQQWIQNQ